MRVFERNHNSAAVKSLIVLMLLAVHAGSAPLAVKETRKVWMCHHDPWQLGADSQAWTSVRQRLNSIVIFIGDFKKADITSMRRFAEVVNAAGIRVGVECAGLCDWRAHLKDKAAEASFADEYGKVRQYLTPVAQGGAGGRIDFLQFDHPIARMFYAKVDGKSTRTGYHTLETATDQLMEVMRLWRRAVPQVEFYLIPNFPHYGWDTYPAYHGWRYTGQGAMGLMNYKPVLEMVLRKARAAPLPVRGLVVDNPYDYAIGDFRSNQPEVTKGIDWIQRLLDLERFCKSAGMEFGLVFNSARAGSGPNASDALYTKETLDYIQLYLSRGGAPDNYIIESWYKLPSAWMPEDRSGTLTHLVRTVLDATVPPAAKRPRM